VLTYGSNATYHCQASMNLSNYEGIGWIVTIGGQMYSAENIPLKGTKYNHNLEERSISLVFVIQEDKVNTNVSVRCAVMTEGGQVTYSNDNVPRKLIVQGYTKPTSVTIISVEDLCAYCRFVGCRGKPRI
jgi:hypothetical protein